MRSCGDILHVHLIVHIGLHLYDAYQRQHHVDCRQSTRLRLYDAQQWRHPACGQQIVHRTEFIRCVAVAISCMWTADSPQECVYTMRSSGNIMWTADSPQDCIYTMRSSGDTLHVDSRQSTGLSFTMRSSGNILWTANSLHAGCFYTMQMTDERGSQVQHKVNNDPHLIVISKRME